MSGSAIETWLARKQRKALLSARFYFVITMLGGIVALLPNFGIAFLICKIALLVSAPTSPHLDLGALLLSAPLMVLLFVDCVRAERDDMGNAYRGGRHRSMEPTR